MSGWSTRAHVTTSARLADLLEATEQLLIGIGMGWDLNGLTAQAKEACKAAGSKIFDKPLPAPKADQAQGVAINSVDSDVDFVDRKSDSGRPPNAGES